MGHKIGEFDLNTTGHTLTSQDGQPVPLTPKEFQMLCLLVERVGEAISKDELLERIWPETFVGETSVAKVVSLLRGRLGATSIQTVSKFGYRFALPVTVLLPPSR